MPTSQTPSSQTKAQLAHRELERMIVTQEITPGQLISEADLMTLTGYGRTPVREALQRLARERMVEIHPNKGVMIPATSVESQLRLLEVRRPLEAMAARLACTRATTNQRHDIDTIRTQMDDTPLSAATYLELLQRAQHTLVHAARNDYLTTAIAPLHGLSRRFWYSHLTDTSQDIAIGSHLYSTIFQAILHRDEDTAEKTALHLNDYLVHFTYASLMNRVCIEFG